MVSISEQLQSHFDYHNHLLIVLTVVDRGGASGAPLTPKAGLSSGNTHSALPKAQGGRSVSVSRSLAKRTPRTGESIPHQLPEGATAGVQAHGLGLSQGSQNHLLQFVGKHSWIQASPATLIQQPLPPSISVKH